MTRLPLVAAPAVVLGDDLTMTLGVVGGVVTVAVAIAEARWHVSAHRERLLKAEQQIAALNSEVATLRATQSTQAQQITHIIEMLTEMRADVKRLLQQSHP